MYYNIFLSGDGSYILNKCKNTPGRQDTAVTSGGTITCPNKLLNNEGIGSLQETSETELMTTKDSKITIAVVVSIILTVFCAVVMFMLYRKYKTANNNVKENKDYDLETFYSATTTNNNYKNQNYSNNPVDNITSSSEQYNNNKIKNDSL